MTLTVAWSVQARNQFVATLTYIAKEDPLSAELVHKRVEKSLKLLCDSPEMGVQAPDSRGTNIRRTQYRTQLRLSADTTMVTAAQQP
ncbi:MAG: type II toxin-antitoxin system RelE/ParE family toxin [Burkholderiales bacterium]|nr:type II toxin-antitoxin system RelE/ParE family toxin [Burkholderiales bacterium]